MLETKVVTLDVYGVYKIVFLIGLIVHVCSRMFHDTQIMLMEVKSIVSGVLLVEGTLH
jgi:hypothetical protein